jgi:amino acid adenylation domain-containing protein
MQLDPDNPAYHNVNTWHLRAPFDRPAFLDAVERVVARHPVLRTSFDLTTYSEPLQLVHEKATLPVSLADLRDVPPTDQRQLLEAFWQQETVDVFDLAKPPYVRFHIHRRSDETFQFTLTELHAILDGWSVTSTLAEVFEIYLTLLAGKSPQPEPPLATSFRDFVQMERQALASAEHQRFWVERLSGAAPTRLPRWPGYPRAERARFEKLRFDVPPEVAERVRTIADTLAVPFKSVLLAAHVKVLSVASGGDDILTGLVTNGRLEQLDGERVPGLFLNTVPFRQRIADGTWSDLVRQVFTAEREMLPYRRYPVAALQAKWGRQPLYEVAFTFLNFHSVQGLLQSGEIAVLEDDEKDFSFANFTLNLTFFQSPVSSNLRLIMEYDSDQLDSEQMSRMQQYYLGTLEAMAEDPLARHDVRSLLSEAERHQLLAGWNNTWREVELLPLPRRFEAQVERTPTAIALGTGLTYRDLDRWANRLAHRLRALGAGPEVVVAIFLERSPEMVAAILGVLKAGGAYLPLDRDWPRDRRTFVLADAGAPIAISTSAASADLGEFSGHLLELDTEELAEMEEGRPAVVIDPENLAYVIYTSGSTGRPKGTLLAHRGLSNYLAWCIREYEVEAGKGALVHSSLAFDLTITGLFAPLLVGRRVDLVPEDDRIGGLAETLLRSRNLSLVKLTPGQLDLLSRQIPPREAAGHTRSFVVGGEVLTGEALRFWQEFAPDTCLVNEYGPTEAVVGCITYRVPKGELQTGAVPIGSPIANCRAHVLDRRLQLVPVGAAGELFLGGLGLARGYLRRPELTAQAFIPDPFAGEPGGRLYRTGDQVLRLPEGSLQFLGRQDDQVKLRGFRVELEEVRAVLCRYPAVREAVAVVREDGGLARLVAYVVPQPEERLKVEDLRRFLKQQVPEPMVPAAFVVLAALPLTTSGKVDRRALPTPGAARPDLAEAYQPPQSELEEAIACIWREVLQVERVGVRDNFFELGGDSLRLFQAYNKLRLALARDLPLIQLLRYPTIESLTAYLSRAEDTRSNAEESEMRLELLGAGRERLTKQRELLRRQGR